MDSSLVKALKRFNRKERFGFCPMPLQTIRGAKSQLPEQGRK